MKHHWFIAFIALSLVSVYSTAHSHDTLRILAIGNSFSMDAIESELLPICQDAGIPIEIGNLYYGGCSLEQHTQFLSQREHVYSYRYIRNGLSTQRDSVTMLVALKARPWNVISLQQASHDSGDYSTYSPFLQMLIDSIRAYHPNARLAWHMTWAYAQDATHPGFPRYQSSQAVMYDSIVSCTRRVMRNYDFDLLIPVGQAIQLGRQTRLGDNFCRDGYHLNHLFGRYTAACVWAEVLTGLDCRTIRYRSSDDSEQCMPRRQQQLVTRAAHTAVHSPIYP